MSQNIVGFIAGIIFGLGLCISQMVNPNKVISFLDILGNWDPSLAFVMIGALSITMISFRFLLKQSKSILGCKIELPTEKRITPPLIIGAIIFGIGWGLAGFCPAPAITSLSFGMTKPLIFVFAMIGGMGLYNCLIKK